MPAPPERRLIALETQALPTAGPEVTAAGLLAALCLLIAGLLAGCKDVSPTEASLRGTALLPERLFGEEPAARPAMEWAEAEESAPGPLEALLVLVMRDGRLEGHIEQHFLDARGDTLTLVTVLEAGLGATMLETAPDGGRSDPGGTVDETAGAALRLSGS